MDAETSVRTIESAEDVTPAILEDVEQVFDGWFADEPRIDWEDFIDRLDKYGQHSAEPYGFETYWSPAVRKIQRHVKTLRASQ